MLESLIDVTNRSGLFYFTVAVIESAEMQWTWDD